MSVRRLTAVVVAAAVSVASGFVVAHPAVAADPPVGVTVDLHAGLGTVPTFGIGANHAIWDTELGSTQTSTLLKAAGVSMLRYPGGSYADIYHWQTTPRRAATWRRTPTSTRSWRARGEPAHSPSSSRTTAPARPRRPPAGSGTPTSPRTTASSTGRSATRSTATATTARTGRPTTTPTRAPRGTRRACVAYAGAMKAVDPNVKIGAVLTTPGNWPDGIVGPATRGTWNQTVLSIAGPYIDFVILHWYPGGGDADESLAKPDQVVDIAEQRARRSPVRRAGVGPDRHLAHRDQRRVRHQHAAGRAVRRRRLPALWAAGCSRSTGGTSATASAP